MEHLGLPNQPTNPMPELIWLRKIIVERALTRGDYVLSGGVRSDYYIDKFRLFSDPQVLRRIARLFVPVITETNPDLIAGTELGGVVISTAVSSRFAKRPRVTVHLLTSTSRDRTPLGSTFSYSKTS
jgi:orotate phosphoribosyltransferase